MAFLPHFFLLEQIMSGGNLVVHWRTPNQRRPEWCATNVLQRSVVVVGKLRASGAVTFQRVGI